MYTLPKIFRPVTRNTLIFYLALGCFIIIVVALLTHYRPMDFSIKFDIVKVGWSIVFKGGPRI